MARVGKRGGTSRFAEKVLTEVYVVHGEVSHLDIWQTKKAVVLVCVIVRKYYPLELDAIQQQSISGIHVLENVGILWLAGAEFLFKLFGFLAASNFVLKYLSYQCVLNKKHKKQRLV